MAQDTSNIVKICVLVEDKREPDNLGECRIEMLDSQEEFIDIFCMPCLYHLFALDKRETPAIIIKLNYIEVNKL